LILSIETSTNKFSVSICEATKLANINFMYKTPHSQKIVQVVKFLLESIDSSIKDINQICVDVGPGSFTGIRIGLSFVNTLFQTLKIPICGVSSLDLLAVEAKRRYEEIKCHDIVVTFIKSRKNEVYTAVYRDGNRVTDYLAIEYKGFSDFINKYSPFLLVSSEDDYNEVIDKGGIILKTRASFSYPKASLIYPFVIEYRIKFEKHYIKPLYIRGI